MIRDPELRAAVDRAFTSWEKHEAEKPGGQLSIAHPIGPRVQLHYCHDCGHRFFNKGWHAEACGSGNYSIVTEEAK